MAVKADKVCVMHLTVDGEPQQIEEVGPFFAEAAGYFFLRCPIHVPFVSTYASGLEFLRLKLLSRPCACGWFSISCLSVAVPRSAPPTPSPHHQVSGLWALLTGNAPAGTPPAVTVEFDFEWPDAEGVPGLSGVSATMLEEWFRLQPPGRRLLELRCC